MTNRSSQLDTTATFRRRYPGPYFVARGTDGVDRTLDICCGTTQKFITAVAYWDDHAAAARVAGTVRLALEHSRNVELRERQNSVDNHLLREFLAERPGPLEHRFLPASSSVDADTGLAVTERSTWAVLDSGTRTAVIGIEAEQDCSDAELIVASVAEALNLLRIEALTATA